MKTQENTQEEITGKQQLTEYAGLDLFAAVA
jgi:hypothetical protein